MKIALLSFEYPPETGFGGIGSYTWHHARALVKLGHDVHVLAGAREPTPLRATLHDGVRVYRFWARGPMMRAFEQARTFRLWWTRQRLQNAWSMYHGVSALHRKHRYDVIEMPECGAEGALVTRLLAVPTVVRLHSPSRLIMPYYDVRRADIRLCSAIEQQAIDHATALTACSKFVAEEVTRTLHVTRPISVVTNGLDVRWFDAAAEPVDVYQKYGLPRRRLMIVFTGRMERRKGIHLCTEIASSILERFDVTFVLAGDDLFGYLANTLLPTLASRRLVGSVHWLGALGLADVRELVRAADIFLLPSLWENCPYSCLEAMAAGRAVVAADQGGMPELIESGVNGLLAVTGHVPSFVQRIEQLIDDAALRAALGHSARETILHAHGHTHAASQALAVYENVIAGRTTTAESVPVERWRPSLAVGNLSVSVIIPAYNAAETLAETLNSVCAQVSPCWEAIVIDDGSTDSTAAIARAFAERDPRFRVLIQPNGGEAAARNAGIGMARYDWLVFLDADDWISPRHLERLTAELIFKPVMGAVHCGSVRVATDGTHVSDEYQPPAGDLFPVLARRAAFPVHACIVRRSLVEAVGGFDTSLKTCADWDMWQRIARTGVHFGAVPEVLAYYRMRQDSASIDAPQLFRDDLRILNRGHAPDPRVVHPHPTHADGAPRHEAICQQFYLLSWCAGLMMGAGKSAMPLFDMIPDARCSELYANAIAQCLFEAGPLPTGRAHAAWDTLWPTVQPLAVEFLAALEHQSQTPALAERAISHLRTSILTASIEAADTAGRSAGLDCEGLLRGLEDSPLPHADIGVSPTDLRAQLTSLTVQHTNLGAQSPNVAIAAPGSLHPLHLPVARRELEDRPLVDLTGELLARLERDDTYGDTGTLLLGEQLRQRLDLSLDVHLNRFAARRYRDLLQPSLARLRPSELRNMSVVDLGCGSLNPFTFSFLLLMLGAERACALDLEHIQDLTIATRALATAASWFLMDSRRILGPDAIRPEDALKNLHGFQLPLLSAGDPAGIAPDRLQHRVESIYNITLPDGDVDAMFSVSLLEHLDRVDDALESLRRISKPGAVGHHVINFSDHRIYSREVESPFAFLAVERGPSLVHGSNRLRCHEFHALFEQHGFVVEHVETWQHATPLTEEEHAGFAEPYRSMKREDVMPVGARFFVRRR